MSDNWCDIYYTVFAHSIPFYVAKPDLFWKIKKFFVLYLILVVVLEVNVTALESKAVINN